MQTMNEAKIFILSFKFLQSPHIHLSRRILLFMKLDHNGKEARRSRNLTGY